jgi:2-hydroxychromene-2-carboxylate isomerase
LSMMRIQRLAAETGLRVALKPFMLGPIFKTLGWETSPFVLQTMKGNYVWRDMQRQCDKYGLRWQRPSVFPRNALLAARVALQGEGEPWLAGFCEQVMLANFADDREIGDEAVIAGILIGLGADRCLQGYAARAHRRSPGPRHLRRAHVLCRGRDVLGERPP